MEAPCNVRIPDAKYAKFAATLASMGLRKQEFRVVEVIGDKVVVDPSDLSPGATIAPFPIRRDLVEPLS